MLWRNNNNILFINLIAQMIFFTMQSDRNSLKIDKILDIIGHELIFFFAFKHVLGTRKVSIFQLYRF